MAATGSRRGQDDRRPSVLATPEAGRVRGEASLPAHRAGGRIPVGGAGLRSRLAAMSAVTTAVAALAFLVPLGWELRSDHRDQVMSAAQRRSAMIAGAIAAGADQKGLAAAVAAAGGRVVVDPPGDGTPGRVGAAEVRLAVSGGAIREVGVSDGLVRLEPVTVSGKTSVVEV